MGSRNVALATARLISLIVQTARFTTFDELVAIIKGVGRKLAEANSIGQSGSRPSTSALTSQNSQQAMSFAASSAYSGKNIAPPLPP